MQFDWREKLSERIGLQFIKSAVELVENNNKLKEELYNCIFDRNDKVVINALWVMTHFSKKDNEWLFSKQDELIGQVLSARDSSKERLLLTLIYKQPISESISVEFLNYCFDAVMSRRKALGVTVLCQKIAYRMCMYTPELLHEFQSMLDMQDVSELEPSLKASRKHILKAILKK